MIRVTCDNCADPIDRDDPDHAWFGVDVTEPFGGLAHPDPVQAMNDAEEQMVSGILSVARMGGDHEFHFCSAGCLGVWAMNKEMNR